MAARGINVCFALLPGRGSSCLRVCFRLRVSVSCIPGNPAEDENLPGRDCSRRRRSTWGGPEPRPSREACRPAWAHPGLISLSFPAEVATWRFP